MDNRSRRSSIASNSSRTSNSSKKSANFEDYCKKAQKDPEKIAAAAAKTSSVSAKAVMKPKLKPNSIEEFAKRAEQKKEEKKQGRCPADFHVCYCSAKDSGFQFCDRLCCKEPD